MHVAAPTTGGRHAGSQLHRPMSGDAGRQRRRSCAGNQNLPAIVLTSDERRAPTSAQAHRPNGRTRIRPQRASAATPSRHPGVGVLARRHVERCNENGDAPPGQSTTRAVGSRPARADLRGTPPAIGEIGESLRWPFGRQSGRAARPHRGARLPRRCGLTVARASRIRGAQPRDALATGEG